MTVNWPSSQTDLLSKYENHYTLESHAHVREFYVPVLKNWEFYVPVLEVRWSASQTHSCLLGWLGSHCHSASTGTAWSPHCQRSAGHWRGRRCTHEWCIHDRPLQDLKDCTWQTSLQHWWDWSGSLNPKGLRGPSHLVPVTSALMRPPRQMGSAIPWEEDVCATANSQPFWVFVNPKSPSYAANVKKSLPKQ